MQKLAPLSLVAAALIAAPLWAQEAKPDAPKQIQPVPTVEKQPPAKKDEAKKTLAVGDDAPAFKVEAFVKGEPVKSFEKGKVYVVEFWATWCGPCVAAFPHLSKMQADFKDKVTFIGTNIWERPYNSDTLEKVKTFVADQGDKMAYTVAFDGKAAAMDAAYMKAAGRNGIPSAFIVNQDGKIAWMGHPMSMDKVLEEVVAGKYDLKAAAEKEKAAKDAETTVADIKAKMMKAARAEKWDEVAAAMDEMAKADPANKGEYLYQKYNILTKRKSDYTAAYAMKDQLLGDKTISEDSKRLNEIAWNIVDPKGEVDKKDRNLDFALAFANKANEVTKGEDGMILDTVARVYWEKGDRAKAIELQEKAVKACDKDAAVPDQIKDEIKATLETYKKENAKSGA
jgi:thiol-disulfide isomerase/thioredoxin